MEPLRRPRPRARLVLGQRDGDRRACGRGGLPAYLATHPATARTIARKLALRFVSDAPSTTLVEELAKTYLANDTAIAPVLRRLFTSQEFLGSAAKKTRRPYEDLVATLRILGMRPDASGSRGIQGLYWMLEQLGQQPLAWNLPDGYPDIAAAWQSPAATLARWDMHVWLAATWWPKELQLPDLRAALLPAALPATHGGLVDPLSRRLVWRTLAAEHRDAVLRFLDATADKPLTASSSALGWRLPYIVALVLDSPHHLLR